MSELRAVRGMNDIVPPETDRWQALEATVKSVLASYGYREIRLPIVESTQVFSRSIGDTTDIVQKEMYTFTDRNGDSLTLRPEGTAGCIRAVLENGLIQQTVQRLYYCGPMFRHERPQKGRYRQFHQVGVEAIGMAGPDIDAEIILLTARLWRTLGLKNLRLELNTLGAAAEREHYRTELVAYFSAHTSTLDADSQHRLTRNPLRILDSKNPDMKALIADAPPLHACLGEASKGEFAAIQAVLDTAGVIYTINPRLVRGLDYYSKTVFEWITEELGAQGTVCAGGRYDTLVEQMGGRPTPAIGFALGLERLLGLLDIQASRGDCELYVVAAEAAQRPAALALAEDIREAAPTLRTICHCGSESLKTQMKRADRSGAHWALIIGPDELVADAVTLKPLRGQGEQRRIARRELLTDAQRLLHRASE
ncbi:MAG: histidine--tRNA ligase [Gammaproteobacteria bacterium]|nr:histidine--tRNA ligase [Gammaproteobacteria bacterium]